MLYKVLKFIISIGIRLYYREVKVNNIHNVPEHGPLIIIANHPNTIMDAWVIGMLSKQPIYYLAKGTLFNSKWKLRILRSLKMIPINRQGEQKSLGVDNSETFQECYELLGRGKIIVVFPEGTSYRERVLRELKTGAARIALEAEKRYHGKLGLKVIAVGLNYSQPEKFRSDILIDIDKPESVLDFLSLFNENQREGSKKLTLRFRQRLEKVVLTTETIEEERMIEQLFHLVSSRYIRDVLSGVRKDVEKMKLIKNRIDEMKILEPWKVNMIFLKMRAIQWKLDKMKIRADFLDRRYKFVFYRQIFTSLLFIVVAMPVFIYGFIHNGFQYFFTDKLITKLTKDIEYYAPFAVLIGIVLYPLMYVLFLYGAAAFFGWKWFHLVFYGLSLPISGLFAFWLARYIQHINYKINFIFLVYNRARVMQQLKADRTEIRTLLFNDDLI